MWISGPPKSIKIYTNQSPVYTFMLPKCLKILKLSTFQKMGKKSKEKLKKIVKNQKTLCGNFNLKGDNFGQFFNIVL